jgi:TPR repeat protein
MVAAVNADTARSVALRADYARPRRPDIAEQAYRKAADAGDVGAMESVGSLAEARGDLGEAAGWYRKAADAGDLEAMRRLGSLAANGDTAAVSALRKAANDGALWAMHGLRQGAEAGNPSALEALRAAADDGALWATEMLGWLAKRRGDQQEAEAWFRRAADAGDPTAIRELGRFAEERGEFEQAIGWYRRITGDPEATEALRRLSVHTEKSARKPDDKGVASG